LKEAMKHFSVLLALALLTGNSNPAEAVDLIPPLVQIKKDHPRLLRRPQVCPGAISVAALRDTARDAADQQLLAQVRDEKSASAQAMVWLLTGDSGAADRAIATMHANRFPGDVDTLHDFFTLTWFALAYDWLHGYAAFTPEMKAEVGSNVLPLAERGLRFADDHMFHNYIWMSAGGVALWALATAGDDAKSDQLFGRLRQRFNSGLFPAWQHLDGLPSEPMGHPRSAQKNGAEKSNFLCAASGL
jgi:hypothetical protein